MKKERKYENGEVLLGTSQPTLMKSTKVQTLSALRVLGTAN